MANKRIKLLKEKLGLNPKLYGETLAHRWKE